MRERAKAAAPGQWLTSNSSDGQEWYVISRSHGQVTTGLHDEPGVSELVMIERDRADAEHIAGWGPVPALAVAALLEAEADHAEQSGVWLLDSVSGRVLAVARAYLGGEIR